MNKQVLIKVDLRQIDNEGQEQLTQFTTDAKYYKKDDTFYLVYKESKISGMEGTTTTIKIEKDSISIIRFGNITSNIILSKNKSHIDNYQTQYGTFELIVKTNTLEIEINEAGGKLLAQYDLEMNHLGVGINYLNILIN